MNPRAVIFVLILVAISLAATLWIGKTSLPANGENLRSPLTASTLEPDREAPFPVATIDEAEYNFGEMELGSSREHVFVIRNTGKDALKLQQGTVTCKCTMSNLENEELAPGKSAEIKLTWTPKSASEMFSQNAEIFTNDPNQPKIELAIMGRVLKSIEIFPDERVNAGNLIEKVGADAKVFFISKSREELEPPTVKYEGDQLTFDISPLTVQDQMDQQAKTGYTIRVHVKPTIPVGEFRDQYTLEYTLDGEKNSLLQVVSAHRLGPIMFLNKPGTSFNHEVQLLRFGRFPAKEGKQANLTLLIDKPESGEKLEVLGFECEKLPDLKLKAVENTELDIPTRAAFDLLIEMPPGAPAVDLPFGRASTLMVLTNHPVVPKITLYLDLHSY